MSLCNNKDFQGKSLLGLFAMCNIFREVILLVIFFKLLLQLCVWFFDNILIFLYPGMHFTRNSLMGHLPVCLLHSCHDMAFFLTRKPGCHCFPCPSTPPTHFEKPGQCRFHLKFITSFAHMAHINTFRGVFCLFGAPISSASCKG